MTARTEHTPGPWYVAPNLTSILCGDPNDPEVVATTAVSDIMGVCGRQRAATLGFEGRETADGWSESEANACLIAAAPALLAALEDARYLLRQYHKGEAPGHLDACDMPDNCAHCLACRTIDAAIAKARGNK
jgi:hypothetical protein